MVTSLPHRTKLVRILKQWNELKLLYEVNKRSTVTINIPFREIENIEIEEIVKQGAIYRPVLCCVITARVNDIGGKLCCK